MEKANCFWDKTRGNLFFEAARIFKDMRPKCFMLEKLKIYNSLQKNMQLVYDSARRQEYGAWNYT